VTPSFDSQGSQSSGTRVRKSYDTVARTYADEIYGELAGKPFDRGLLDRFAERVRGRGKVCDMGCGPAQIMRYLRDRGVDAFGLDFSAGMLAQARRLNPDASFVQSSMLALGLKSDSLGGVAAFYSIIHIPRPQVVTALAEIRRTLSHGGLLLVTFHLGSEDTHHEEMLGHAVSLDVALFTTDEMSSYFREAGFKIEEALERDPYAPDVEYQSRRGYILASRPAD
jgi:SAM-dependent methyltransferase